MSFSRMLAAVTVGALIASPLAAQGIPRGGRISVQVRNTPRMLVGTPYAFASADSAAAVRIGRAMRDKMSDIVRNDYHVISDSGMNAALEQFGYPKDAILTPAIQRTLAQNLGARFLVTSTLTKEGGSGYTITARLSGINDDAGQVVTARQQPNQQLDDLGKLVASQFDQVVDVLDESRECMDQLGQEKYDKARDAAQKVLKKVPDEGLANYCLARIAMAQKAPRDTVMHYLETAVHGDSLSLRAWTEMAVNYEQVGDSANTIKAFQQLLRIAPTNQKLREEAFRLFLNYGRPDAAKEVADEGLKIDPYNADLYDLKSNACLFQSDFECAIGALAQEYQVDSTKADTLFFAKILVAAAQQPDTAQLLHWSQLGSSKYPDNVTILGYLNQAYALSGQVDSSLAVTRKLMAVDSTAVAPALAAVQALATAHRTPDMGPFVDFVKQHGTPEDREKLAVILVNAALPLLQDSTKNYAAAADLARQSVALADPNGKLAPSANYVLGLSVFLQGAGMDAQTEKAKSCDMAKQEQALFQEAEQALTLGRSAKPDVVDQYLGYVAKYKPRTASMIKAYCK